jgi:DNA-binding Lrp family transcriptional regulator
MNSTPGQEQILQRLSQVPDVSEVYEIIGRYQMIRHVNGRSQNVTLEIFDAGERANPLDRYHAFASTPDGRTATGNPDASVERVLENLHWEHLDR